jgi:hypothetical protein
VSFLSHPSRHPETDHTGADHDAINFFHSQSESGLGLPISDPATGELTPHRGSVAFALYCIVQDDFRGKRSGISAAGSVPVSRKLIMSGNCRNLSHIFELHG